MYFKPQSDDLNDYLKLTDIIDYDNPEITALARDLKSRSSAKPDLIRSCFEYVRDEIHHSADIEATTVTCKASEVLRAGEGLCYAKSHLLAALLRSNGIPCGFCYQMLRPDGFTGIILHGLNGVYLEEHNKWIRLDARGNKGGINSRFSIAGEQLAYPIRAGKGEKNIPAIFSAPDPNIINALTRWQTFDKLWANLPGALKADY